VEESRPPARKKTETLGPALSAGLGSQYVGLGIQASYYLQLPDSKLRAAPFLGLGTVLWTLGPQVSEGAGPPGTVAGISTSWGWSHRLTVDFFYGAAATTEVSLHGETPDTQLE
jgi:hypothetical protein